MTRRLISDQHLSTKEQVVRLSGCQVPMRLVLLSLSSLCRHRSLATSSPGSRNRFATPPRQLSVGLDPFLLLPLTTPPPPLTPTALISLTSSILFILSDKREIVVGVVGVVGVNLRKFVVLSTSQEVFFSPQPPLTPTSSPQLPGDTVDVQLITSSAACGGNTTSHIKEV